MLYILVGPDGAGKSTCFKALKSSHILRDRHAIFVKESHVDDEAEKYRRVTRLWEMIGVARTVPVFYDRATAIDDSIYSPIIDNKRSVLRNAEIDSMLNTGCVVIHIDASNEELVRRIGKRGDQFINANQIACIKNAYAERLDSMRRAGCAVRTIDTTGKSASQVVDEVWAIVNRKEPKFAHIVPVDCLHVLDNKQYLMCLAHLVKANGAYGDYYASAARKPGTYVLMDNGVAEGEQLSNEELLRCYDRIRPSEIILPDTLCDSSDTLRKMHEALELFVESEHLPYRIMAVPQGHDLDEWIACAEAMVRDRRIHTIGVSKFLQMAGGSYMTRYWAVDALSELIAKYGRSDLEVHLLGCSEPTAYVQMILDKYPFVRGCDSALGYLFAQAQIHPTEFTERPDGEIDFLEGPQYEGLSEYLVDVELGAHVYNNYKDDPSWR